MKDLQNQVFDSERDLSMSRAFAAELRANLELCVCRLYDIEIISASRACELLGIKAQEFGELFNSGWEEKWQHNDDYALCACQCEGVKPW